MAVALLPAAVHSFPLAQPSAISTLPSRRATPSMLLVERRGAAALLAFALAPWPEEAVAAARKCKTVSNPALTVVTCNDFGVQADGRLVGCEADEACVAPGAVTNPSKFAPPWAPDARSPEASDPARAWRSLVNAVQEEETLTIVERDDKQLYLRATAVAQVPPDGVDDVEFLLRPGPGRVTTIFRSATRQRVFVYPLQQPVPNQDSHTSRLRSIRGRLGWEELGYDPGDAGSLPTGEGAGRGRNFFGLQLRGASVPEDFYDDD